MAILKSNGKVTALTNSRRQLTMLLYQMFYKKNVEKVESNSTEVQAYLKMLQCIKKKYVFSS